jgi:hypothetical protein
MSAPVPNPIDARNTRQTGAICRRFGLLALALGTADCSPPHHPAAAAPADACVLGSPVASSVRTGDSLVVASPAVVDEGHAPWPTNDGERFAFAQVYETLIDVDCDGRPLPALAQSWTRDATGTRATFVLRAGARFSSGDFVTSRAVVSAWRTTATSSKGAAIVVRQLARQLADGATVVDDRTLTVSLPDTSWRALAEPALAVFEPRPDESVPIGSGPYRIERAASSVIVLTPTDSASGPRVVVASTQDADARDAIDAGAALVLDAAQPAASYAHSRPGLAVVTLPWTRTYVLIAPNGAVGVLPAATPESMAALRASLARDAVRAEARAATPPYWWVDRSECGFMDANDARPAPVPAAAIAYRDDDLVARGLAERLVALRPGLTAVPLGAAIFAAALRDGRGVGFVVALPHESLSPCGDAARLFAAAPWLAAGSLSSAVVPLVETRARAIVDSARASARVEWDGTLRLLTAPPR